MRRRWRRHGRNPEVFARRTLGQVADHTVEVIAALDRKPAVLGHSTGGLLAQVVAGRGPSAATVAIDPGVFRGVLPLPVSVLKGVGPFLADPRTRGARSRSPGSSSGTAGRTRWTSRRLGSSTTPTTSPAPASR
ncbi:alpha/beta fold hydrolase [Geodermatophilus sp. SYSU D00815]